MSLHEGMEGWKVYFLRHVRFWITPNVLLIEKWICLIPKNVINLSCLSGTIKTPYFFHSYQIMLFPTIWKNEKKIGSKKSIQRSKSKSHENRWPCRNQQNKQTKKVCSTPPFYWHNYPHTHLHCKSSLNSSTSQLIVCLLTWISSSTSLSRHHLNTFVTCC